MREIKLESTLSGHLDRVWCVKWHPNGRWLASCGADRSIMIWAKEGFFFNRRLCINFVNHFRRRTMEMLKLSN